MSTLKLISNPFSLQYKSSIDLYVPQSGWWELGWFGGCSIQNDLSYKQVRFVLTRYADKKIADAKLIICNLDVLGLGQLDCNFHFDKGQKEKQCIITTGNSDLRYVKLPHNIYQAEIPTLCGVLVIDHREEVPESVSFPEDNKSTTSTQLLQDLTSLLDADPEGLSDALLKCSGVEIPVHKCILAARSPVFAAMFRNKMAEAQNNAADIVDVEPDILRWMLKYIYCGQVEGIPDGVERDLLYAADKYGLEDLKQFCISKMKSTMSVDNVCDILVCGELHDQSLKAHAIDFICKQKEFSKLEDMEQWKLLVKDRPRLAVEVLTSVVKHQEGAKK